MTARKISPETLTWLPNGSIEFEHTTDQIAESLIPDITKRQHKYAAQLAGKLVTALADENYTGAAMMAGDLAHALTELTYTVAGQRRNESAARRNSERDIIRRAIGMDQW